MVGAAAVETAIVAAVVVVVIDETMQKRRGIPRLFLFERWANAIRTTWGSGWGSRVFCGCSVCVHTV
jgi:hypothetical protein